MFNLNAWLGPRKSVAEKDTTHKINKLAADNAQYELDLADQSCEAQESPLEITIEAHVNAKTSI